MELDDAVQGSYAKLGGSLRMLVSACAYMRRVA